MSPNIWATFEENIVVENCHKSPSQVTLKISCHPSYELELHILHFALYI